MKRVLRVCVCQACRASVYPCHIVRKGRHTDSGPTSAQARSGPAVAAHTLFMASDFLAVGRGRWHIALMSERRGNEKRCPALGYCLFFVEAVSNGSGFILHIIYNTTGAL